MCEQSSKAARLICCTLSLCV